MQTVIGFDNDKGNLYLKKGLTRFPTEKEKIRNNRTWWSFYKKRK